MAIWCAAGVMLKHVTARHRAGTVQRTWIAAAHVAATVSAAWTYMGNVHRTRIVAATPRSAILSWAGAARNWVRPAQVDKSVAATIATIPTYAAGHPRGHVRAIRTAAATCHVATMPPWCAAIRGKRVTAAGMTLIVAATIVFPTNVPITEMIGNLFPLYHLCGQFTPS